jgi:imidazolonepropionase-like amidohydrolase
LGFVLLLSGFADANGLAAEPASGHSTVLVCGKLFDGSADQLSGPMEILVADGKISQIAPKVERPEGAAVIDLSDHTVLPGFFDLHVHVMGQSNDSYYAFLERSQARTAFLGAKNLKTLWYGPLGNLTPASPP